MLISKEKLLADIADAREKNKKAPIIPIIEAAEAVKSDAAVVDQPDAERSAKSGWITDGDPEEECCTFVKVKRPYSTETYVTIAKFRPSGYHNGGRNKWDIEQVVGPTAGHKVVAWHTIPEA